MSQILNSITCPIDDKVSLIEASAGTGKTYNIQNLFVRMIMEMNYPIESILVVTFTDAATRELKSRIRGILTDLSNYFENRHVKDMERVELLANSKIIDKNLIAHRINNALRNFDKASIFTIHGFCKKSLDENAFATSSHFNQELQKNTDPILQRIVHNFFRKYFYNNSAFEHFLNEYHNINIKSCISFLKDLHNKSGFIFTSDLSGFQLDEKLKIVQTRLKTSLDIPRIKGKLTSDIISQAKDKYTPENIDLFLRSAEDFINHKITATSIKHLEKFITAALVSSLKAKKHLPADDFFDAVDELFKIVESYKIAIYQKLYHFFLEEFQSEKHADNFRTFDDLIHLLDESLKQNQNLINQISKDYNAVLIDEFQDTDKAQYSIFHQLFIDKNKPTFLIGDPKQAIYSFRGGDIYAYKIAKEYVDKNQGHLYTLPINYRSSENMVNAINDLITDIPHDKKFLSGFIDFEKADIKTNAKDCFLYKNQPLTKSLKIFNNQKTNNDFHREIFSINQTVNQIYQLISDKNYQIYENETYRPIAPSDIAILVNTHRQASALLPHLHKANIPAVVHATGSVFDSNEAKALNLVLKAIDEPGNLKIIRGALTTFIFDVSAEQLHKMHIDDAEEMDEWILFFRDCQRKWVNGSFIEAFNFIISKTNLKQRLLSMENGDRKVTNLMHLQELIQQEETESSLGLSGIANWFQQKINADSNDKKKEEAELRLETDENALKIMTIHKSKGLEFPIVFCPFLWSSKSDLSKKLFIEYHNEENQKVIDLVKSDLSKAETEILEENIRLVYVALTRAKYAVYLCNVSNKNSNAIKYFLSQYEEVSNDQILTTIKSATSVKSFDNIQNVEIIDEQENDLFTGTYHSEIEDQENQLIKPQFSGNMNKQWQVSSFSSLLKTNISGINHDEKDYDENTSEPEKEEVSDLNIFNFPAGAKVGSCWHEIFEDISFHNDSELIMEIAKEKLLKYGLCTEEFCNSYAQITTGMIENVLHCQLSATEQIKLQDIFDNERINELEFFFSLKSNVDKSQLNHILETYNIAFDDNIPKGFMTGFIDLVFRWKGKYYIADWKSNALGLSQSDFSTESIVKEMHHHKYNLQYLIYTVALYKYLKLRIADFDYHRDFGGVFYIFLRGVNKNIAASGIYYDLPEKELIEQLVEVLG